MIENHEALLTAQTLRIAIFSTTAILLGYGYYLQFIVGLEPCPLCITQRFFLALSGALGLLAALQRPTINGARIYGGAGTIAALSGSGFSARQLYLQSLPAEQVPACGPSIEFIFNTFPLLDALEILLRGDGNCAEVSWRLLGLSIPGWTLLVFLGLAAAWLWQIRLSKQ